MKRIWCLSLLAGLIAPALGGCSPGPGATSSITQARGDLGTLTYRAIDRLVAGVPDLTLGQPVVVGSIVDVQRVDKALAFGNLIADLARSRLVQKGVPVSEMRLRNAVLLDARQGEMALANDRNAVRPPPLAAAILTGTYAAGDEYIFVSLKLVGMADARIVGAVDYAVPRNGAELLLMPPQT